MHFTKFYIVFTTDLKIEAARYEKIVFLNWLSHFLSAICILLAFLVLVVSQF